MNMSVISKKPYKRTCPKCKKDVFHTDIKNRNRADKIKKMCSSCGIKLNHADVKGKNNPFYGKKHSEKTKKLWKSTRTYEHLKGENHYSITVPGWKEKISKSLSGKNNPMYGKTGNLNPFYGKKHSEKTKLLLKQKQIGKKSIHFGKKHSEEHNLKIRISHVNRLKNLGLYHKGNFNTNACKYFDILNNEKGWNLQHALNGGEIDCLGYSLDAYDKNKNIAVEYDESYHYDTNGNLKTKDIKRMNRIINHLKCKFYRYNSLKNKLEEHYLPTSLK